MLINCDIGERGVAHKTDDQLMAYIDIANIACGGHAGDKQSADYYYSLANTYGIEASVHLSYPDRQNFGRLNMDIDDKTLLTSLDQQYDLLSEVKTLKFHGALYNEANVNKQLAQLLIQWAGRAGIEAILTPENSAIAQCCCAATEGQTIRPVYEVFLDRQYVCLAGRLCLKSRKESGALITDTQQAVQQYHNFNNNVVVIDAKVYQIRADTACIHSDSANVLGLIRAIKNV